MNSVNLPTLGRSQGCQLCDIVAAACHLAVCESKGNYASSPFEHTSQGGHGSCKRTQLATVIL